MSYFPMFVEMADKMCLVAGGGKVALRKIESLKAFGAKIFVVSPVILPEIKRMEGIAWTERPFETEDLTGCALVIAATDDASLNHKISVLCREAGILVNAVDQIEDCGFIFPAFLKEGEVVAAFSSGGLSPATAQYLKEMLAPSFTPLLGELAAQLGSIRPMVKGSVKTEGERKRLYKELLCLGIEKEALLTNEEIKAAVDRYRRE